jgi:alpha-amylase
MRSICFYFQVHQPFKLKTYRFFDIGHHKEYFDEYANGYYMQQMAEKCYLPTNKLILELIRKHGRKFRVSFNISGMALEQFEMYTPDVLQSFRELAATGNVEFLASSYGHGLASLKSQEEFKTQVKKHELKIIEIFGVKPTSLANTELIYNDDIANMAHAMGYNTVVTEGAKHILGWKSPNLLYCSSSNPKVKLLFRNFQLSDDIGFRFSEKNWSEWPLTADKFTGWINALGTKVEVMNLFMNYETFGQHQPASTGIFDFLKALPKVVFSKTDLTFNTPSEVASALQPAFTMHVPYPISWADEERDITPWLGNEMQNEAHTKLYALESMVNRCNDPEIYKDWYRLQSCNYFYYMSTKWFSDGIVKRYYNPYSSPYDAFINYMNILADFEIKVRNKCQELDNSELNESADTKQATPKKLKKKVSVKSAVKRK